MIKTAWELSKKANEAGSITWALEAPNPRGWSFHNHVHTHSQTRAIRNITKFRFIYSEFTLASVPYSFKKLLYSPLSGSYFLPYAHLTKTVGKRAKLPHMQQPWGGGKLYITYDPLLTLKLSSQNNNLGGYRRTNSFYMVWKFCVWKGNVVVFDSRDNGVELQGQYSMYRTSLVSFRLCYDVILPVLLIMKLSDNECLWWDICYSSHYFLTELLSDL